MNTTLILARRAFREGIQGDQAEKAKKAAEEKKAADEKKES